MDNLVFQGETMECGLASLATVSNILGYNLKLEDLRGQIKLTHQGVSLESLSNVADYHKMKHDIISFDGDDMLMLPLPSIVHLRHNHFVVLTQVTKTHAVVLNPAIGKQIVPLDIFKESCSGYALSFRQSNEVNKSHNYNLNLRFDVKYIFWGILLLSINLFLPIFINNISDLHISYVYLVIILLSSQIVFYFVSLKNKNIVKKIEFGDFKVHGLSLYNNLLFNNIRFFEKRILSDLKEKYISYCSAISRERTLISNGIISLFASLICVFVSLYLSLFLTMFTIGALLLTGIATSLFKSKVEYYYFISQDLSLKLASFILESVGGIQTIKSANKYRTFRDLYAQRVRSLLKSREKIIDSNFNYTSLLTIVSNIELALILIVSYRLINVEQLQLESFLSFLFVRQMLISHIHSLYSHFVNYGKIKIDLKRGEDMISYVKDPKYKSQTKHLENEIELEDVKFSFDGNNNVLNIENIKISKGCISSIFGKSGAGKSTLLKLISGYYQSEVTPKIKVDREVVDGTTMRSMSYLSSTDEQIFEGTIEDNITLFSQDTDRKLLNKILDEIGLLQKIERLPNGIHEVIKEDIHPFSYGEKRRLLLCRAIYSNKSVVFLDEPTANLDSGSASKVVNALVNCKKTVVVATHDPRFTEVSTCTIKL
ncbi:cysteine peptidase family C39 domain-containing protein [Vibrio harveyi]